MRLEDLTGQKFGRLTVVSINREKKGTRWHCVCDCGRETVTDPYQLKNGQAKSCGCLKGELLVTSNTSKPKTTSKRLVDLTGQVFGHLTVESINRDVANTRWNCVCTCGKRTITAAHQLKTGRAKSCGCQKNVTHGLGDGPEMKVWYAMLDRCENPKSANWDNYGARGISVCERWHDPKLFLEDMGPRPSDVHSIDRVDVNGNYEPSNCRWATDTEQMRNRRCTKLTDEQVQEIRDLCAAKTMTQRSIARLYGVSDVFVSQIKTGKRWVL